MKPTKDLARTVLGIVGSVLVTFGLVSEDIVTEGTTHVMSIVGGVIGLVALYKSAAKPADNDPPKK